MNVTVLMASGEADTWDDVADAIDDRGSLIVLADIESVLDDGGAPVPFREGMLLEPSDIKTMVITREFERDDVPEGYVGPPLTATVSRTFQVMAQYAPGMWIKVEFE